MKTPKKRESYCVEDLKRKFTSMIDEYKDTVMSDGRKPVWVSAELVFGFAKEKGEYDGRLGPYEKRVMTEVIESRKGKDVETWNRSNRRGKRFYFVGRGLKL